MMNTGRELSLLLRSYSSFTSALTLISTKLYLQIPFSRYMNKFIVYQLLNFNVLSLYTGV